MLAVKMSAGVTPEVNFRNVHYVYLCQVQIRLPTLALKPRGDITRSPKQGYQWTHKKDICQCSHGKDTYLPKIVEKRFNNHSDKTYPPIPFFSEMLVVV